jgi:autotransporter-associated beta strand protein
MKTLLCEYRRAKSAVVSAIFFAALASTLIAQGQITYVTSFGSYGSGTGQFKQASGVAVSPTGEIYVADTDNSRIVKYFDLAEWVSGSPHLGTAAVGYGQLLGASLTMSASQGLQVDGAMTIQPGGYLQTLGGNITAGSFTNSGQYYVNGGTLTVSGGTGTLTNNATMSLYGGVVAASLTNYYGASLTVAGAVTGNLLNQGTLTQSGVLSVSGSFTNAGTANIGAGSQLLPANVTNTGTVNLNGGAIINGGNFTNTGTVILSGGAITGGGNFANAVSGAIRGDGTITMTLSNQGLIYANGTNGLTLTSFAGNQGGGELLVANGDSLTVSAAAGGQWTNSSIITLTGPGAALNGGSIFNGGTISGQGRITNTIYNYGTITAVGGQLVLTALSSNNSPLFGFPVGTIQSAADTSILVPQGLPSNSGLIALTGGSFDNGDNPMTNYGSILGNGTFSSSGLTNSGTVTFSDGNSSIFGPVTNSSGGTISSYGTSSPTTVVSFFAAVTNKPGALIQSNSSTLRFLGGLTNNGTYISDPAANYFSGLAVGASGVLQGGMGDSFFVTGPFTNAGQINLGGNSAMVVENGGQTSGVLHLGASATLTAGTVEIDGGTLLADGPLAAITASLVYASSSASTYQGILAGAGNSLTLNNPAGAGMLTLSGSNTFSGPLIVKGGTLNMPSGYLAPAYQYVGYGSPGSFTQSGGTDVPGGQLILGNGGSGTYNLSGNGLLSAGTEFIGYFNGGSTFTQSGGTNAVSGNVTFGFYAGSSGTYNLNGGLLSLAGSSALLSGGGAAAFNFGGGTLGASAPWSSSLAMNLSGIGGPATVDTSGGNIGLSGNLSGSGGLTEVGSGLLILSGSNTYTGGTTVEAGTLDVLNSSALPDGSSLTVGADATLIFGAFSAGSPVSDSAATVAVPEPGTLSLLIAGGVLFALYRRRL